MRQTLRTQRIGVSRLAAAVTSALLFVGCSGVTRETVDAETHRTPAKSVTEFPSPTPDSLNKLPCESSIYNWSELEPGYRPVLEAIALPTWGSSGVLDVYQWEAYDPPNYFAKFGLHVKGGAEFSLRSLHPPATAGLNWTGLQRDIVTVLHSNGCPGSGWLVFAGGIWVDEPRCVQLEVKAGGTSEIVDLGIGVACEDPPDEQTDKWTIPQ